MALEVTTGYTDDGLVFLKFQGAQQENGRPLQSIITLEPDMAEGVAKRMLDAAKQAQTACKRPLIVGQNQTFKKG